MSINTLPKNIDAEFNNLYLPHLRQYVVPVTSNPLQLGSGVLVNVHGRHFVATAAHCIESSSQVLRCTTSLSGGRTGETQSLRILQTRRHDDPDMDIGYLEIEDPKCAEVRWDQLSTHQIVNGLVHVVGYPASEVQIDQKRKEIFLLEGTFSTSLLEETEAYLKFNYPKDGLKYSSGTGEWVPTSFPDTPKGFSGGGCFGVTKRTTVGGVEVPEFNLLGIQSCWLRSERYVKVIPIKKWCDLLQKHERL